MEFFLDQLLEDVQPSPFDSFALFDGLDSSVNSDDNSSNTSLNSSDESPNISDISFFGKTSDFPPSDKLLPISKPISKKKRKASTTVVKEEKKTSVTLDRDLLINMSLEEFERRIEALTKGRSLTKEETNDIKRQRRLIKNRHSAMASRERKREEFTILKQENDALKKEVGYLKSVIEFLTVGKAIPSADSVPYLLIFGLLFSVLFWSQSPIPIANHLNVTHSAAPIKSLKLLNLNVQQEVRQTPTTREASPFGRELMSYRELNNTLDDQEGNESYDNGSIRNADVPTNYILSRSPVSQIQFYLPEAETALSVSDSDTFSTYSQNSHSQPPSIVVM